MSIRRAVITAAGWGTRFLPVTKAQPKEMLPLLGKPLIQYSVEEAAACGVDLVVIVTSMGKRSIEDHFDRSFELESILEKKGNVALAQQCRQICNLVDIAYVRQKEQLGLGHAVLTAKRIIGNEPFYLFLPDDVFERREAVLKGMAAVFEQKGTSVVSVQQVDRNDVRRYGVVKATESVGRVHKITDLVEKPLPAQAPSNLAIMGRYLLTPDVFEALETTPSGANGEIQLTDGLKQMARRQPMYAYEFEGQRFDAGTLFGWLQTNVAFALKDPEIGPGFEEYLKTLINRGAGK